MSFDRLIEKIKTTGNPTVAGLDPRLEYIPEHITAPIFKEMGNSMAAAAECIWQFNKQLIDILCDIVPAIKPQCAYYEMYGWQGMYALKQTVDYAKSKGMFVINDGKRNDIGATMTAYAAAHLGKTEINGEMMSAFDADALTVNSYLGSDGIDPLLSVCKAEDKGIFVLVKTSNPSSGELQDLKLTTDETIYEKMAQLCNKWGEQLPGKYGYNGVGAVVGATYPEQLKKIREISPETFLLIPGYGAQGGGSQGLAPAFDKDGLGAIVNSSRAIMCAYKKEENCAPEDFAGAARREAIRMKEDICSVIG